MKDSNKLETIFQKLEAGESRDLLSKENIWDKLEQKLDTEPKQENKKVIAFPWWKSIGIAASLALILGLGYWLMQNQSDQNSTTQSIPEMVKLEELPTEIQPIEMEDSEEIIPTNEAEIVQSDQEKFVPKPTKDVEISEQLEPQIVQNSRTTDSEGVFIGDRIKKQNVDVDDSNSTFSTEPEIIQLTKVLPESKPMTTIKGFLEDEYGPIGDAEVSIKGKNLTTITDGSGKFDIAANIGDVLVVTDLMGITEEFPVTKDNLGRLKFGQTVALQKVVLIGGIKMDSAQQVGSYSVVKSEDIKSKGYNSTNTQPIASIEQALAGRVAGIQITPQNGQPGTTNKVAIRGVSSLNNMQNPLYVIDGIVVKAGNLNNIDPNIIKEVTVLKDASATALYGARAANGVIIINTKKGLSRKERRELEKLMEKQGNQIPIPPVEVNNEEFSSFIENKFESPKMNPLSTFSVDVDKAAYSNIRRMLNNGQKVPKDAVRIEEMINYFSYKYPQPQGQHPFLINTEYSEAPWNPGHKLVKIGLQGKNLPVESLPNSNLVFLIDVSGSMNDSNKLPLLKKSFELLVNNLRDKDKVSIVVYAGAAGMVLPPTSGAEKTKILDALNNLSAGGSTAGAAGIELAYQLAEENFIKGGNNRVILATDGDFNVGTSAVMDLETLIAEKRKTGIFLTCLGYGMGNYKDNRMETLANKGNGNYAYIDNLQEANKFLVKEFSGTLYTIAKDVKIQIEFNPNLVQAYRLIGYETRKLNDEDFVNDAIDAGEIGAGHQVTALYEIIPMGTQTNYVEKPQDLKYSNYTANAEFQNELATVKFRYKKTDGEKSIEIVQPISNHSSSLTQASEDFKFASAVAWFGLKLRDSEFIQNKETKAISDFAKQAVGNDPEGYKAEFIRLVELVK
ncbi:YfbK domain-containing protein [Moheibacter stercoris]|uniref:Ca-activated chloride channel family protein n=1 Tax=Moheibacter stercoris TaxID=1628251 RepID=A0ABV2LTL9_9FLAO